MDSKLHLWQQCKLKDVAYLHKDQVNPVVLGDILVHHYSIPAFDEGQVPKQESAENIKSNKFSVPPDAVLLSKLNPRFPRVWLPQIDPIIKSLASTEFLILRPQANTDRRFLKFLCSEAVFMTKLLEMVTGTSSSHQRVRPDDVLTIEVDIPPLPEQHAIAAMLGALDDKIELNRQMNKTLEAMAQAIFKSWFVDFEPFRDQGMEDSPLGPIPRGWRAGSFGDIISEKRERMGGHQAIVLSAVSKGELVQSDEHFNKRVYSKNINKYLRVEQWDFAYNPSRINIGSIGMLKEALLGAVSPVYVVFRPNLNYHWFIDFALRQNQVIEWINTLASGSVRQSLTFNDFTSIPCVIPPTEFAQAFTERWNIILSMIKKNKETSVTIGNIRDALLPKLLSGEIRIKEAEKFVEETV